ncbi:hypothetical protein [Thiohalocapsa sp. ML1]|uniref:hypothetical protein n=1 Tax=Thiohalocapsa sp. ML1 TaxID=1431688 RepID=UPI00073224B7|nr:hypothetical protein [Thiohalocapsa sp. ML1]
MPTAARRGAIVDIPLPAEDRRVPSVVGGDDRVTATRQVIGQDRGEDMVVLGDLSSATCLRRLVFGDLSSATRIFMRQLQGASGDHRKQGRYRG